MEVVNCYIKNLFKKKILKFNKFSGHFSSGSNDSLKMRRGGGNV